MTYKCDPPHCKFAALLILITSSSAVSATGMPAGQSSRDGVVLAQNSTQKGASESATPLRASSPAEVLSWPIGAPQRADGASWTAERGTMALDQGAARLQPDRNRRVVLLSPPALPDAVRNAEQFVLGLSGAGLERVRVQARRDARGGWITIADVSGAALRESADRVTIKRWPGARDRPIERLRLELTFRTTNPRPLTHISASTAPV